ncbi:hypothetical protein Sjap_021785 [Stephania japonica]|uniref:Uncharacterized protein n=1 Tax=Stephania japonica TaxID=461633 RepID=A0AAP0ETC2_9MAGN
MFSLGWKSYTDVVRRGRRTTPGHNSTRERIVEKIGLTCRKQSGGDDIRTKDLAVTGTAILSPLSLPPLAGLGDPYACTPLFEENATGNFSMASYYHNYDRFEESYHHGMNGVGMEITTILAMHRHNPTSDTYSSMRNQPSRDIIRFLLETEQDMNLTEQELDQWIEQRDQEAEEEIKSIFQKISAETMSAIPLESVKIFYMADTFVSNDDDAIDSYVLEVPDELLHLKEGMYDELRKAIDASFVLDISKGEGIT